MSFIERLVVQDTDGDGQDDGDGDDDNNGVSKEAKIIFWGIVVFLLLICTLLTVVLCK